VDQVLLEYGKERTTGERFGENIVHAVVEIHLNVIAPDVRGHGNDWRIVKLSNDVAGRDSVQVWHDNIHEDHIVSDALV
jgi:hypothetical protein